MRIPRSWLFQFLPEGLAASLPGEKLISVLTMGIAEVEGVETIDSDEVYTLELKPDRGDCLCVLGIAREVAALAGSGSIVLQDPPPAPDGSVSNQTLDVPVHIDAPDLCQRYVALVMEGIRVGPSPDWLQQRIRQVGLRPVNNVVDVTNYVMFELNQPLHAFDLDRLEGPAIQVRRARPGERIVAINGDEIELSLEHLVIADAVRPAAIAGVMGGLDTEVTESTTRILIESARFDPISVRRTSRRLALGTHSTDSAYRFARKVDESGCLRAGLRAAQLIGEVAGGRLVGPGIDRFPNPAPETVIRLRPDRVCRRLGITIDTDEMVEALQRLGLVVGEREGKLWTHVPGWRADLEIEEDLSEEVARMVGYDRIPSRLPSGECTPGGILSPRRLADGLRDALVGSGYTEVRSYSLTSPAAVHRARLDSTDAAAIRNETSAERTVLRPWITPFLLEAARANLTLGISNQSMFEIGRVFSLVKEPAQERSPVEETTSLAGLALGSAWSSAWNRPDEMMDSDFYAVRGVLENAASSLRLSFLFTAPDGDETPLSPALHPGRCAVISLAGGARLGMLGELHPDVSAAYGLPGRPVIFELSVDPLLAAHEAAANRPVELDVFHLPPATRDLAVVISRNVSYGSVIETIRGADPLVTEVSLFDLYRGAGIADDEQSLAFSIVLRSPERTLTDAEANGIVDSIVLLLAAKFARAGDSAFVIPLTAEGM